MASNKRYRIPAQRHRVEEVIRRSRFITTVGYAPTVEDARLFIAEIRNEFPDATHNCWAYVVGPPGSTSQIGMSDDGEPHGTAGRPMLTVLLHSEIGDIVAVVTRYFGGTKLGKGGLVKAYSGGVQLALEGLPTVEKVPKVEVLVAIDYSAVTPLQRELPEYGATIVDEVYASDVNYRIRLPEDTLEPFLAAVANLTNGQAKTEVVARSEM